MSNTAHDQTWQKEHDLKEKAAAAEAQEAETGVKAEEKPVDINQGKGIPGWVLRVEGRLIDVSHRVGELFIRLMLIAVWKREAG